MFCKELQTELKIIVAEFDAFESMRLFEKKTKAFTMGGFTSHGC